jgi:hypothetical protein
MSTRNAQLTDLYLRYRLAEQQRFYRARAKLFQKARNQSRLLAAALLFCASVAGALGGADVADARRWWAVAAGLLSASATALTSYEAVYGFDRLSREYERTIGSLARVEAKFPSEAPGRITRAETTALISRVELVLTGEVDTWSRQTAAATFQPGEPVPVASPAEESPPSEARTGDP